MRSLQKIFDPANPVYLDYNATTPIDPRVFAEMQPFLGVHFGNPSSAHIYGVIAKKAVSNARRQMAELINCEPENILFTSGGTESNNHAIRGYVFANRKRGNHIIISQIEHPAVVNVCEFLKKNGFEISLIPVDECGLVDPAEVAEAIRNDTILISVMHANNEVGTIQPVKEIAAVAHRKGIVMHCDAAQSVGKIPVDVKDLEVDLLSIAGHKFYAPKGVGALYIRPGTELKKFMLGGNQEADRRAGTENVAALVALGKAAEIAKSSLEDDSRHSSNLRDLLQTELLAAFPAARINGHPVKRLPNTLNISFSNADEFAVLEIFTEIAASAGAACHADSVSISPVLQAMQVPPEYARGTIRFSVGRFTTEKDIIKAVEIVKCLLKL